MSLISTSSLTHAFGAEDIFREIAFRLDAKERVGLVGPNGIGKTTLLKIIAGDLEPAGGEIVRLNELATGYLHQEAVLTFAGQQNSIYEEMLSVFASLVAVEKELRSLENRMAAGEVREALLTHYSSLQIAFEARGGYEFQLLIKQVLEGLGFDPSSWQTPLNHLSGGQKTRLLLGRLLLERPDLLILDEPTNHLDSTAVEWLERTLQKYPGTLLMVSHDRFFLDRVTTAIWDMSGSGLRRYSGNYSSFVQQRQAVFDREAKLFEAEMDRLHGELEWIRRHIAGGKTDMAKGKLKRLTRDIVLIEQVGVIGKEGKAWSEIGGRVRTFSVGEAADRLKAIPAPSSGPPPLNIRLKSEEKSGILVLKTQRLEIGFPQNYLFKTPKMRVERQECAAIIGPNGCGKSTLIKTLLGHLPPLKGKIDLGDNVITGYFAQAHDELNEQKQVIEEILSRFDIGDRQARNHLASYLFRGDDVFKMVGSLSGGERGRLALAILALQGANFLLLDEPTNHLDIPSQEVLQGVLERFDGTILLVSHDRYLIDRLATQIWTIKDGKLSIFYGSYQEFLTGHGLDSDKTQNVGETERGKKIGVDRPAIVEIPPADLGWVEDIAPLPASAKKQRGGRTKGTLKRISAYLERLYEELELAQLSGDEEECQFLESEIEAAEAEYEASGGNLE